MSAADNDRLRVESERVEGSTGQHHRGHSRWMMVACCVPMLIIAAVIALSGRGFGFFVVAVACTAMMAMMMGAMGGQDGGE